MTNETRAALVGLLRASHVAGERYRRNLGKMQFLSFKHGEPDPFLNEGWVRQLDAMKAAADEATAAVRSALAPLGLSAETLVSLFEEAEAA